MTPIPIITTNSIKHVTIALTEAFKPVIYRELDAGRYLDILLALMSPAKASMQYMTTHRWPPNIAVAEVVEKENKELSRSTVDVSAKPVQMNN